MSTPSNTLPPVATRLLLLLVITSLAVSCENEKESNPPSAWQKLNSFPGNKMLFTAAAHDDKYFLFFGVNRNSDLTNPQDYKNDVWMYNPDTDEWSERNDYGNGPGRFNANAFAIGDHIYVIGGRGKRGPSPEEAEELELNEFLQYNPGTDAWTTLDPFPGQARSGAISIVVNGLAYFGLGASNDKPLRDFWQYNPETSAWKRLPDFPGGLPLQFGEPASYGNANSEFVNFAFDDRIVVMTGVDCFHPETWGFDTSREEWAHYERGYFEDPETEVMFQVRSGAASVVYDGSGYVMLGTAMNKGYGYAQVLRYNGATNAWKQIDLYDGFSSHSAFSFPYKNGIIIGTDYNPVSRHRLNDAPPYELWMFIPELAEKSVISDNQ